MKTVSFLWLQLELMSLSFSVSNCFYSFIWFVFDWTVKHLVQLLLFLMFCINQFDIVVTKQNNLNKPNLSKTQPLI